MGGEDKGYVNILEDVEAEPKPTVEQTPDEIDVMDDRQFREALLQLLHGIDWKLWEIHQVVQQYKD